LGNSGGSGRVSRDLIIVLDTNMLMLIAEGINVFEQIEEKLAVRPRYVVLKPVINELKKLAGSGKPSLAKKAAFAIEIATRFCEIVNIEAEKSVDDIIVEFAVKNNAAVATNDRELRRKLREKGVPEIYLREESMRIEVEGIEI